MVPGDVTNGAAFAAHRSPKRMAIAVLGSAMFVSLGLWFVDAFGIDHPTGVKATVVGWVVIAFFGPLGLRALWRINDRSLVLRVDDRGVWRQSISPETIPWRAITDFGVIAIRGQHMVGLGVDRIEDYGLGRAATLTSRANMSITGFPLCLSVAGTDRAFDELVEAVIRFHDRAPDAPDKT